MENYPQFTFQHFYHKRYYQGGIHLYQVQLMYEHIMDRKKNEYKFFAGINGIDLDKELGDKSQGSDLDEQQKKQELPLFKDPDEYDDMSQEERDNLTKKMMQKHQTWVEQGNKGIGG